MHKRILRLPETEAYTGLSRATIYRLKKRGEFPPSIPIGPRCRGWDIIDLNEWLETRRALKAI